MGNQDIILKYQTETWGGEKKLYYNLKNPKKLWRPDQKMAK